MKEDYGLVIMMALSVALVSVALVLLNVFGYDEQIITFLEWVDNAGPTGILVFFFTVAMMVVLFIPGVVLTLAAGFLYGVIGGSVLIVLAVTLGAFIAFSISRLLQKHYTLGFLRRRNVLQKWENVFVSQGWRFIALIRMIPFFPFKLSNYYFGLTAVTPGNYVLGTLIGLWPISIFNVYLGSIAGDLMSLGSTSTQRTPLQWFFYLFGFFVVAVCVLLLLRYAKNRMPD